jgi:hypothetical protein
MGCGYPPAQRERETPSNLLEGLLPLWPGVPCPVVQALEGIERAESRLLADRLAAQTDVLGRCYAANKRPAVEISNTLASDSVNKSGCAGVVD